MPQVLAPWSNSTSPPPRAVPVTVVVLTLNEILNIRQCLASLGWADQVMVVDSGSTDGTVEASHESGALVLHKDFVDFASQRNWALERDEIRNEWVFMVDADNWVSGALAQEIAEKVGNASHTCYAVRLRLVWQGQWIRLAGWYRNSWQERLFLRDAGRYEGIHSERLSFDGDIGLLQNDLVDEDQKPFERWLAKHNHYSTLVARQRVQLRRIRFRERIRQSLEETPRRRVPRELAKRLLLPSLPGKSLFVFIYLYLIRGGFLHGRTGFWFCALHAGQQMVTDIKIAEIERQEAPRSMRDG